MKMKMHEFCIIASGLDPKADDFETRFFDVGCDDATVSFQKGHIIVDFTREAQSLEDAIASAIEAVRKAGANVMRVEPDPLVSLSDMAARAGMSRAAMSHYFKGTRARDFPAPVAKVTSESPLWDWATVARWMFKNDKLGREAAIEAEIVRQANEAISAGQIDIASRLKKRVQEYSAELQAA
jgi:predicted DNA-binding transcriptional regulator AlpA